MALGRTLSRDQHVVKLSRLGEPMEHLRWILILVILKNVAIPGMIDVRGLRQRHSVRLTGAHTQSLARTAVGSHQTNLAILELLLDPDVVLDLVQLVSSRWQRHQNLPQQGQRKIVNLLPRIHVVFSVFPIVVFRLITGWFVPEYIRLLIIY